MNGDDKPSEFDREALKRRLKRLEAEIRLREAGEPPLKTARSRVPWKWYGLVGGAMLAAVCWLVRDLEEEKLFSSYYQPYPNVMAFAGRSETVAGQHRAEAMRLYENGHYQEALERFETEVRTTRNATEVLFYAGISCIELNRLDKAEAYLQEVSRQADPGFAAQAQWYRALIHLKRNEPGKARTCLRLLTRHTETHREKASELLREL